VERHRFFFHVRLKALRHLESGYSLGIAWQRPPEIEGNHGMDPTSLSDRSRSEIERLRLP